MTTPSRDEVLAHYDNEPAFDPGPLQDIANSLERIATALEQGVLERMGQPGAALAQAFPELVPRGADPYPQELEPVDLPPVTAAGFVAQSIAANLDVCPIHNAPWKTVPAGVSKKTGKPYSSFRACSVAGCDQRPRL